MPLRNVSTDPKERACLIVDEFVGAFYHAGGNNDQEEGYGSLRSVHETGISHVRLLNYRG